MKLLYKLFLPVIAISLLSGCSVFDGGKKKKTFSGPWAGHAKAAWNAHANMLRNNGIPVRSPSPLTTSFVTSTGTMGGGNDRFPYVVRNGKKLGGWLKGSCNTSASVVMVREAGGFFNANIATHEVGHHINNHALCLGDRNGHPHYMGDKGGMPHWPYWLGARSVGFGYRVSPIGYDYEDGDYVCLLVVSGAFSALSEDQLKDSLSSFALEIKGGQ